MRGVRPAGGAVTTSDSGRSIFLIPLCIGRIVGRAG